ncbi:MAG: hypothetical protein AABW68_03730, partial [archaeon]
MDVHDRFSGLMIGLLVVGMAFLLAGTIWNSTSGNVVSLTLRPEAKIQCETTLPSEITGDYRLCAGNYPLSSGTTIKTNGFLQCEKGATLYYPESSGTPFSAITIVGAGKIKGCTINGGFSEGI